MSLFLKRKEINEMPVAMLAYILCKTEGSMIKNKIEFAKWKRTNLVVEACYSSLYGGLLASSKENRHAIPLCGSDLGGIAPWPYCSHFCITLRYKILWSPE